MNDILLITPPFTQLNTPYPATAYLKGFLNSKNITSVQVDLGIEVILSIFSHDGLIHLFDQIASHDENRSPNASRIYALRNKYINTIDEVILFLQGENQSFARQIASENYLPQASRFQYLDEIDWAFGEMGFQDKAKHLATLYLEDLSDFIVECVDEHFGFSRYAESLGKSANSFDALDDLLHSEPSYVDQITLRILEEKLSMHPSKMICFSVPFPGNLYSAFRCASYIKTHYPDIAIAMGGGFPNTELRSVKDKRVFSYFDYITLDDGELPIELLITKVKNINNCRKHVLKRTFLLQDDEVVYADNATAADYKQNELGTPDYSDLLLNKYISVIEVANPMHSLWSDGRWLKLTMAHGCYWGKCTFCDVSLDYIKRFEPLTAKLLVDRVEELIAKTGEKGFHFVDEAAPPALMKAFALELLKRKVVISWWTNIRFEKRFTPDLCRLLKASGCIAVSGGLEVASDRLLNLIDKGVSVEQVAQVTHHFTKAGIMVHSYLMYGYPSQTIQETIDSLEMVRQLFEIGVIQSGFWHRFALTAHSPIGLDPKAYAIKPQLAEIEFANNDVEFVDSTGIDHAQFSEGLRKSLYNYMHGAALDLPLQKWFDFKVPKTMIPPTYIAKSIEFETEEKISPQDLVIWLGSATTLASTETKFKAKSNDLLHLKCYSKSDEVVVKIEKEQGEWLLGILEKCAIENGASISYSALKKDFETQFEHFELFWQSKPIKNLRSIGLLVL